jgi:hypothetical protein
LAFFFLIEPPFFALTEHLLWRSSRKECRHVVNENWQRLNIVLRHTAAPANQHSVQTNLDTPLGCSAGRVIIIEALLRYLRNNWQLWNPILEKINYIGSSCQ